MIKNAHMYYIYIYFFYLVYDFPHACLHKYMYVQHHDSSDLTDHHCTVNQWPIAVIIISISTCVVSCFVLKHKYLYTLYTYSIYRYIFFVKSWFFFKTYTRTVHVQLNVSLRNDWVTCSTVDVFTCQSVSDF